MTGTRESLGAMIGDLAGIAAVRRRILQTLLLPRAAVSYSR